MSRFSDILDGDPHLRGLPAFLRQPDNLIRMDTATYLGRPAAEALGPVLLATFGDAVRRDRVKQAIGYEIRQIQEARGQEIDRQNVRIQDRCRDLFTNATRYRLKAGWSVGGDLKDTAVLAPRSEEEP